MGFSTVDFLKMHNVRVAPKFYLGQNEDCSLGNSVSDSSEKTALRKRGEEPGCIGVLQQRAGSQEGQRIIVN